jgi:hypothetical protein
MFHLKPECLTFEEIQAGLMDNTQDKDVFIKQSREYTLTTVCCYLSLGTRLYAYFLSLPLSENAGTWPKGSHCIGFVFMLVG